MRHRLVVPVAALALSLVVAPAAHASLPKPKSTLIKPGSSIAGVKYGMDAKKAIATWGKGGSCDGATDVVPDGRCTWKGSAKQGEAYFEVRAGKVIQVGIRIGQTASGELIRSDPLTKWKDKKKIGLGSTQFATAKAYKKAFPNGGGLQLNSGKRATIWGSSSGRNYVIDIGSLADFGS
jgi:hypothetical protein